MNFNQLGTDGIPIHFDPWKGMNVFLFPLFLGRARIAVGKEMYMEAFW